MKQWRQMILGCVVLTGAARAEWRALDDPVSPIKVEVDEASAGLRVTWKATGAAWSNAEAPTEAMRLAHVQQADARHLAAEATTADQRTFRLAFELKPATGDLVITIGGNPMQEIGRGGLLYPRALFPADGSGHAILPFFGGYAVPTAQTKWTVPWSHARMEWFGGVDGNFDSGWMFIAEPAADMQLTAVAGNIGGEPRLGGAFRWLGSNANPTMTPNRLSYERRAILRCFGHGGYVAQAKHFRAHAQAQRWFKTLKEKAARNAQVDALVGAPVIYLWGDGRSVKMLDALKGAGIEKALIQLSINHVDQDGAFPNTEFADGDGWARAVRARGYVAGIYDIYAAARTGGGPPGRRGGAFKAGGPKTDGAKEGGPPREGGGSPAGGLRYSGFSHLWPSEVADWRYADAGGEPGGRASISHQMSTKFAREVRLPSHLRQFGLEAFFFDTVCAVDPREDYDARHGHTASRAQDIAHRIALLETSCGYFNKLTGTELIKSWAVPYVHWVEGMFRLGSTRARGQVGAWNNNAYPEVMVDVADLGENLGTVLDPGFQVPLWELVYHETLLSVQHWHMVHNKVLHGWDLADQFALLRGQAPILNLVYAGEKGRVGRELQGAKDAAGRFWDTRWVNAHTAARVAATYRNVCRWHAQVAHLEMIDHRLLAGDFSVQRSEFSGDGGRTGWGIVVNLGRFDGAHAMAGPAWSGEVRGKTLPVPVNGFATYAW